MKKPAKKEVIVLMPDHDKPFTVARKWTEQVAGAMQRAEKNARIYVCSGQVEQDIRPGAYVYDYAYVSDNKQIYLIDACSSYDDRAKANQLVERFLEMYPTPLMLQKDLQDLIKLMAKQLK